LKIDNRLLKLRQRLSEEDIEAIFISQSENRHYLSGFDGSAGFLLITPQKSILATDFRYIEQAKGQAPDYEIFQISGNMVNWFPELVAGLGKLGFEAGHITFAMYRQLTDILNKAQSQLKLVPTDGLVESLRAIKETEEIINSGEPVLIDIGARVGGYSSDLSRTICLGAPDDTFNKVYDTVLGAQLAALAIVSEGMTGGQIDNVARTVIQEAGYGEAFGHSLGHGVGLAPHEQPRLSPNSPDNLVDGMVFTVEPGIYLSGWGGVRIEDLAVMENGKPRVISQARKVGNDK
jgi:Xaa-Pro aminopeptidase